MVALAKRRASRADLFDDSSAFVPEDDGQGDVRLFSEFHADAAMANTAGRHANSHFVFSRVFEKDVLQHLVFIEASQNWGLEFHRLSWRCACGAKVTSSTHDGSY
ncbi:hypothetical protein GCM10017788_65480 [Amycolatopsis acidiphila]|nr:hypothetical protein GCM10017788_65480 [Amycolatopsis acidiphila]